jgi:hypothetical protein
MLAMKTLSVSRYSSWNQIFNLGVACAFVSQSCFAFAAGSGSQGPGLYYVVKKKDSLNKVLRSFGIHPTWGNDGAVEKLLASNPYFQNRKNNANLVYPNERVEFDASFNEIMQERKARRLVDIHENGEVDFNCSKEGLEAWVILRHKLQPDMDPFDRGYSTLEMDCKQTGVEVKGLASISPLRQIAEASRPVPSPAPAVNAPAASPAVPVSTPVVEAEAPEQSNSVFDASLGFSYIGLNGYQTSNSTSGNLVSGLTPTLNLAWRQLWSDDVFSRVYFSGRSISIQSAVQGVSITNSNIFNSSFGVGVGEKFSDRFSGLVDLGLAQTLFYEGLPGGSLQLDQVPLLQLHPQVEYAVLRRRHLLLSGVLGASYFSNSTYSNYSISSGFGYDGGLKITQELKKSDFNCQLLYSGRNQNTTYLNLTEQSVGLTCGLSWGM